MNFDLSTFLFEALNFLVLLWLLQRFLYKPVLKVIAERQDEIEKQVTEASNKLREAESLRGQYEDQLSHFENEKEQLQVAMRQEMQEERERQLSKLAQELEGEQKRARVLIETKAQKESQIYELSALDLASKFTARILGQLASPELERRICRLFLDDLRAAAPDLLNRLTAASRKEGHLVQVNSAFPLATDLRNEIEKALNDLLGAASSCAFAEDPALISGIKVTAGGTVLEASLKDASAFFQEIASNARK